MSSATKFKPKRKKNQYVTKKKWTRDDTELTLLSFPTFVWYILFSYLPMFGLVIAFKKYRLFQGKSFWYNLYHSEWVGFDNFQFFIKSNDFTMLLRNTLLYNLIFIVLGIIIPVSLAIMINLIYSKAKSKIYQTMMFFPHFMSWVVVSYFVYAFLNMDKGLANLIISTLGGDPVKWYSSPEYWPYILIFMHMWKVTGFGMVVYLASISGIDQTLYEAAVIDGARKSQQVRYITLPCLKPIVIMMFILSVGKIFYSDFGLFYQITQRVPQPLYQVASTFDTYIYNSLMQNMPIGKNVAASFFQSVACCITILLANYIVSKLDSDSAII